MSSFNRWAFRLFGAAVIAAVSIFGTLIWSALYQHSRLPVPLTVDLPTSWEARNQEFDRRVKMRFPLDSLEKDMAIELLREGFSRQDWESSVDLEHQAMRDESDLVCSGGASVYWRADAAGRLIAIRGVYPVGACL